MYLTISVECIITCMHYTVELALCLCQDVKPSQRTTFLDQIASGVMSIQMSTGYMIPFMGIHPHS